MHYHIVKIAGKQYKVTPGEEIVVDKLDGQEGDTITLDQVLLTQKDDQVEIGTPTLSKSSLTATIVSHVRGEKIRVATFKAKSRYRRVRGHRSHLTRIQIAGATKAKTSATKPEPKSETKPETSKSTASTKQADTKPKTTAKKPAKKTTKTTKTSKASK